MKPGCPGARQRPGLEGWTAARAPVRPGTCSQGSWKAVPGGAGGAGGQEAEWEQRAGPRAPAPMGRVSPVGPEQSLVSLAQHLAAPSESSTQPMHQTLHYGKQICYSQNRKRKRENKPESLKAAKYESVIWDTNINPSRYFPTSSSFPLLFLRLSDALWKGWKKILKVLFWTENSFLSHCPRIYLIPISYMKNLFGIFWYSLCPDLLLYPLSTLCEDSNVISGYLEAPCIHGAQMQLLTSKNQVVAHSKGWRFFGLLVF